MQKIYSLKKINPKLLSNIFRQQFCSQFQTVSIEVAKLQQKRYCEYSNDIILMLAQMGDQDAKEERLIREIMNVDKKDWIESQEIFEKMLASNRKHLFMITLPYKIGLFTALSTGIFCFPMIFNFSTVFWFNQCFVKGEIPEPKDTETIFEVGNWSWAWMEPITGYASFFLLCMQFARNQFQNARWKPYTEFVREKRALRLQNEYPNYNSNIVDEWSRGDFFNPKSDKNQTL